MTGQPGRSGGARTNAGGARRGAGRPRKAPLLLDVGQHDDPRAFLLEVMACPGADMRLRLACGRTLLPYMYPLRGNAADVTPEHRKQ